MVAETGSSVLSKLLSHTRELGSRTSMKPPAVRVLALAAATTIEESELTSLGLKVTEQLWNGAE